MVKAVQVILGSDSDLPAFLDSKFQPTLKSLGINVLLDVASAHRHPAKVKKVCDDAWANGVRVFTGVAGKAAHLTGAIASLVPAAFVIGIPLKTEPFGIEDSMLAMLSMPPGRVVLPVMDFYNAALAVAQVFSIADEDLAQALVEYLAANDKPPQLGLDVENERRKLAERRKKEAEQKEQK